MFGKRAAAVVARVAILSVAPFMLGATGFTALATALRRRRRLDKARPEQA